MLANINSYAGQCLLLCWQIFVFKVQAVPAQPHGQHGGGTSIFPKVRLISFTEMDMLFGNNFTQGRNHGRRKDYFPAEGTLAGKRNKFLRWAMAYLIALNGNRLGNTYLIFLDGDPIATRPEESWFTLPDVPQILAWCSKPPIWQVNEALYQTRFSEHFLTPGAWWTFSGAWWNQWTYSCKGDFSSTSSCSPPATRLAASLVRDLFFFCLLGLVLLNNFALRHHCGHFGRKEGEVPFAPNLWPVSAGRRSVMTLWYFDNLKHTAEVGKDCKNLLLLALYHPCLWGEHFLLSFFA